MKMARGAKSTAIAFMLLAFLSWLAIFVVSRYKMNSHDTMSVEPVMADRLSNSYKKEAFLIEARGYCIPEKGGAIGLRDVSWSRASKVSHDQPLRAVERDLAGNDFITVRRVSSNVVLIRWADVSNSVLQRKVHEISFSDDLTRSAPAYVINRLWYSGEVIDGFKSGEIRYVGNSLGLFSTAPTNARYLDGQVNDVSIEDVLIKVVSTFGGIVFYSECPRHGGVDFHVNYYYPED